MRNTFKSLFIVIVSMISLTLFSVIASAETEGIFTYTITDDCAIITDVDTTVTGDVVIPETLGGYPVTTLAEKSFFDCRSIDTLEIPESITLIDDEALSYMWCKKIIVSDYNPGYSSDERGVLFNKGKTQIIRYPALCEEEAYEIPATVTEFVGRPFQHCQFGLTYVSIPEGVKTIPNCAFMGATTIKKIDFPSTLETIGPNCFAYCYNLNDPEIPSSVTKIESSAFTYCNALRTFRFPENITAVSLLVLSDCPMLERVYIPKSVTSIHDRAFSGSPALTDIYFEGTEDEWNAINISTTVNSHNNYFLAARKHLNFDASVYKSIDTYMINNIVNIVGEGTLQNANNNWHYWNEYSDEAEVIILEGDFTSIEENVFNSFPNVTTVLISSPGATFSDGAFSDCPSLETVISFSDEAYSAEAFRNCRNSIQLFLSGSEKPEIKNCNVIPFTYSENTVSFAGDVSVDSYTFFDIATAMDLMYNDIRYMKFNSFTCEDITFYRYDEANYNYVPIEGNTLENASFSVFLDSYETGRVEITFNQLCDGISDGSITDFYLVAADEKNDDVLDTEIEIKDEEEKEDNFFIRALKWIVSLLNKLFKLLSKL